jgi:hypothetical protein
MSGPWLAHTDDAAVSASELAAPSGFHVVLGADGSVAIEVSPDEPIVQPAADQGFAPITSSGSALQTIAEPEQPAALVPRTPPTVLASAPKRQLGWSFVAGALVASALLVTGYQLHELWSDAKQHWGPVAAGAEGSPPAAPDPHPRPSAKPEPEPAVAQPAALADNTPILVDLPPTAAGRPPPSTAPPRYRAAEHPPAPLPGPCAAPVAALGLCTPDQAGGP